MYFSLCLFATFHFLKTLVFENLVRSVILERTNSAHIKNLDQRIYVMDAYMSCVTEHTGFRGTSLSGPTIN